MLTTILLYGHLRKRFGRKFVFDIDSSAEAVRALNANLPGFRQHLMQHSEPGYRVIVNGEAYGVEQLDLCLVKPAGLIKIVPVVRGAGDVGKIILGAVLVVAGVVLSPFTGGLSLSLSMAGLSMMIGGVSGLLAATPNSQKERERKASTAISGNTDTIVQGLPIPIGYGKFLLTGIPVATRVTVSDAPV